MWCGCHGVPALALGEERAEELERDQHGEAAKLAPIERSGDGERDPADLGDADRGHVRAGRRRPLGIVARDLPPQEDQRHAHDHVARDHHAVVQRAAVIDRREHLLQPERQHDDPDHLHHRRQAEDPVVGVVGRGEPRVVQPGPAHGEGGEGEAQDAGADVVLGDVVGQLVGGRAEGDDDGQVVEQLQRRGRAVVLVGVAAGESRGDGSNIGGRRHGGRF